MKRFLKFVFEGDWFKPFQMVSTFLMLLAMVGLMAVCVVLVLLKIAGVIQ